jgi:diguanylate cyclase (GGDEF)-like protein
MSRLSRRYAVHFTLLLAGVVLVVLLAAGLAALEQSRALREDLVRTLGAATAAQEGEAIERSAAYLGAQLFNPLYRLDITGLNEEVAQVRRWLPVVELLVLDAGGRVLTDGSARNPRYGERLALPPALAPERPVRRHLPDATELWVAVSFAGEVPGYARLTVSDRRIRETLAELDRDVGHLWERHLGSLGTIAAIALLGVVSLGAALSMRLSRTLTRPLREMGDAASAFAAGHLEHALPVRSRDEMGELAGALNRMAGNLERSGRLLAKAQELAGLGSWEWSPASGHLTVSRELRRLLGLPATGAVTPRELAGRVHPEDRAAFRALFSTEPPAGSFSMELRLAGPGDRIAQVHGEPGSGGDDRGPVIIGALQEVTQQRRTEERLAYLASFDTLTGLPNRYLFQDRLRRAMLQARRSGAPLALLFLDLDRFKAVNDALGHGAGDELLRQVAGRLSRAVRGSDTVARLGGDEFTIILEDTGSDQDVARVARAALEALGAELRLGGQALRISASIGITLYPRDGADITSLLRNADTAMYRAKARGPGCYLFFSPELDRRNQERLALEHALHGALERGELELHYQPQVQVADGRVVGVEALLRWRRAGALEAPERFLPVLEETGLLLPVGRWCLAEACRALRGWRDLGMADLRMAVNLSARQLQDPATLEALAEGMAREGLPGDALELEITETALLDVSAAEGCAAHLARLGVRLAIDDFGTGYSSLAYLKRLAVDTLKVDRSFVRDIPADPEDAAITEAVLALGQSLALDVVAEGVESAEQMGFLAQRHCPLAQGFHIARPMPAAELGRWLAQRRVGAGCYWRAAA